MKSELLKLTTLNCDWYNFCKCAECKWNELMLNPAGVTNMCPAWKLNEISNIMCPAGLKIKISKGKGSVGYYNCI